jgi:hypothetical protein
VARIALIVVAVALVVLAAYELSVRAGLHFH